MSAQEFTLSLFKIFFESLKYIMWPLLALLFLLFFKKPIYDILCRLKNFKFNAGVASFETTCPSEGVNTEASMKSSPLASTEGNANSSDELKKENTLDDATELDNDWLSLIENKLEADDFDSAEAIYKSHISKLVNKDEIFDDTALFLYFTYVHGKRKKSLSELESHMLTATNDKQKVDSALWYVMSLEISKQYEKAIAFLQKILNELKDEEFKADITCRIARLYVENHQVEEAKKIIIEGIKFSSRHNDLFILYKELSSIEDELGNDKESVLCLDKALEYNPDDRDTMFNAAYKASNNKLTFIEISNYDTLLKIDRNNEAVLNNLAVSAENEKLSSVSNTINAKACKLGHSLALANEGFKYLNAGLLDKAEEYARAALEKENPHISAHSLLKEINEKRDREEKSWRDIIEKSSVLQKNTRKYTSHYYLPLELSFANMDFYVNDDTPINFSVNNSNITASWKSTNNISGIIRNIKINAEITNSSLIGEYSEKSDKDSKTLLGIPVDKSIKILGIINIEKQEIHIFSESIKDNFELIIRIKNHKKV